MDSTDPLAPTGELHTTHERGDGSSLTYTIVEAVAAVKGVEPTELRSLQTAVDADALERVVFSPGRSLPRDGERRVEFTFEGCEVTVTSSGTVKVRRLADGDAVSTEAKFQVELARLVREAEANGVAVEGGWACRDESVHPTWGIEIYEVDEP